MKTPHSECCLLYHLQCKNTAINFSRNSVYNIYNCLQCEMLHCFAEERNRFTDNRTSVQQMVLECVAHHFEFMVWYKRMGPGTLAVLTAQQTPHANSNIMWWHFHGLKWETWYSENSCTTKAQTRFNGKKNNWRVSFLQHAPNGGTSSQNSALLHIVVQSLWSTVAVYRGKCSSFIASYADDAGIPVFHASGVSDVLRDVSNPEPMSSMCSYDRTYIWHVLSWSRREPVA